MATLSQSQLQQGNTTLTREQASKMLGISPDTTMQTTQVFSIGGSTTVDLNFGGAKTPDFRILWSFLEQFLRKSDNSTLLGWMRFLDQRQSGKLNFKDFKEAVRLLGFCGNVNSLWSEIFARLDFFSFVMEDTPHRAFKDLRFLTFEKLDPYHFLLIESFRRPLVQKYKRASVAFQQLSYTKDDFFLLLQELGVRIQMKVPPPPPYPPLDDEEEAPALGPFAKAKPSSSSITTLDLATGEGFAPKSAMKTAYFYEWAKNLMLPKERRITRAQSNYLFDYLDVRKQGRLTGEEIVFLDGWWRKPKKKRRGEIDQRALRDPRRLLAQAKELQVEAIAQNSAAITGSVVLKNHTVHEEDIGLGEQRGSWEKKRQFILINGVSRSSASK